MKISNSKKQLARIINENGGWRDGAAFAAQDGYDMVVDFYESTPRRDKEDDFWHLQGRTGIFDKVPARVLISNWHQTILSRDEYFHLYPAPDADGWIEWKGGECPLRGGNDGLSIEYRTASGGIEVATEWDILKLGWIHQGTYDDVEAYRVVSEPDAPANPTIEQMAADYRNAKDYAERKQQEADAAKADAEAKLAELVAAGKALGLDISIAKEGA